MAQIIGLPKLSPTMEEGVLVRWTKKEGDKVSPGDLVAEVETDKANMDFNIEDEGVLLKLLAEAAKSGGGAAAAKQPEAPAPTKGAEDSANAPAAKQAPREAQKPVQQA